MPLAGDCGMHRFRRRVARAAAILFFVASSTTTTRARAAHGRGGVGELALIALVADIVFTVVDVRLAATLDSPRANVSILESTVGTIQVGTFMTMEAFLVRDETPGEMDPAEIIMLSSAAWGGALAAHGMWSAAVPRASQAQVLGASAVVGTDLALTLASTARLIKGPLWSRRVGIAETFLAAPGVVGPLVALGQSAPKDYPLWAGLGAWSGALMLHGITSIARGPRSESEKHPNAAIQVTPLVLPLSLIHI